MREDENLIYGTENERGIVDNLVKLLVLSDGDSPEYRPALLRALDDITTKMEAKPRPAPRASRKKKKESTLYSPRTGGRQDEYK